MRIPFACGIAFLSCASIASQEQSAGATNAPVVLSGESEAMIQAAEEVERSSSTNRLEVREGVIVGGALAGLLKGKEARGVEEKPKPAPGARRLSDRYENLLYYPRSERAQGIVFFSIRF